MKKIVILDEDQVKVLKGMTQMNMEIISDDDKGLEDPDVRKRLQAMEQLEKDLDKAVDITEVMGTVEDYDCSDLYRIVLNIVPANNEKPLRVGVPTKELEQVVLSGLPLEIRVPKVVKYKIPRVWALQMLFDTWENWAEDEDSRSEFWDHTAEDLWKDYQLYKQEVPEASIFDYIHESEHANGSMNPSEKYRLVQIYLLGGITE